MAGDAGADAAPLMARCARCARAAAALGAGATLHTCQRAAASETPFHAAQSPTSRRRHHTACTVATPSVGTAEPSLLRQCLPPDILPSVTIGDTSVH